MHYLIPKDWSTEAPLDKYGALSKYGLEVEGEHGALSKMEKAYAGIALFDMCRTNLPDKQGTTRRRDPPGGGSASFPMLQSALPLHLDRLQLMAFQSAHLLKLFVRYAHVTCAQSVSLFATYNNVSGSIASTGSLESSSLLLLFAPSHYLYHHFMF